MIELKELQEVDYEAYLEMYQEFIQTKSDLIPDVLELSCETENDYTSILQELQNRKNGEHIDLDWYEKAYYFIAWDKDVLIGAGCIRYNLTKKGYDIWGNIAYGVRPSKRRKGYATQIAQELLEKCKSLGMKEVILCHYEDNIISPKIFQKIGANYVNEATSTVSDKKIKRYVIDL